LVHNPDIKKSEIPSDLVCVSGSGLDANISPQAAKIQVERIAKIRNAPKESVMALVHKYTELPYLGVFRPPKVNVLRLNLALDELK